MAQSVEHIVHIDGVVGSSPTVTTKAEAVENQRLLLLCLHPGGVLPRGVLRRCEQLGQPELSELSSGSVVGKSGWLNWWKWAAFISLTSDSPHH